MYSLYLRLWYMLTGWGSVGLVYSLTSSQDQASAIMLQPSFIDQWFAFDPNAIWLYLSFFPYVTLAYLFCQNQKLVWLARSMQFSAIGAGIIFILWPTTMEFPSITHDTISTAALKMLIAVDSMQNCLPSLHVTLTLLSLYAFWDRTHLLRSAFLALWAVAITVSILQLHRHQFIDAISGTALAISAGLLAHYILKLNKKNIMRPVP